MAVEFFRRFPALYNLFSAHCDPNDVTFPRGEMNLMQFQRMHIDDGEHKEEEQPINVELFALARALRNRVRQPYARSGHRIFIDEDFMYIMGGYDRTEDIARIYRDVWRYNLMTGDWQKLAVTGEFPSALASFSLCQMRPFSREFVVFGGTSVPFGDTTSGDAYLLTIDDKLSTISSTLLHVEGDKRPTYGHAMVRGSDPCSFYVIGGTTGHEYFLDVDRLHLLQGRWSWTASGRGSREGRYRLETVLDGDLIYFFGGGKPDYVDSLQELTVFDLKTSTYKRLQTLPDKQITDNLGEDHGFPKGRRCHSVSKWGRRVVLVGGCSADKEDPQNQRRYVSIYPDVWIFDLDGHQWTKFPFDLRIPVFFHDAAVSKEGCLYVWGGVQDEFSESRTNEGQYCWLTPPSLRTFAAMALRRSVDKRIFKGCHHIRLSHPIGIMEQVLEGKLATTSAEMYDDELFDPSLLMDMDVEEFAVGLA